jgi:hypothetical protein
VELRLVIVLLQLDRTACTLQKGLGYLLHPGLRVVWAPLRCRSPTRAGRADGPSPGSGTTAQLQLRWVPVSTVRDPGGGSLVRYALSYRDVEELLAERGVIVDHVKPPSYTAL